MKFRPVIFIAAMVLALSCTRKSEADKFIDDLMSKMTLEEKIGQTIQLTSDMDKTGDPSDANCMKEIRAGRCGSLLNIVTIEKIAMAQKAAVEESRLGIPLVIGYDVIHGYRTCFPIPLGENASWDLDVIRKGAEVAALEAAADGISWTFAPMCDVSTEPRWGRVMEGSTEDPYLLGCVSAARVKGFQGDELSSPLTVAACVKHFAAYGAPQAGREYNTVDMSHRKFKDFYLPSYRAAVKAGAATVMTSFNDFDDVPASGNKYLMVDILRDELGFEGMLVTDYNATKEMINYGVAANKTEAALLSINAQVDMDMVCQSYLQLDTLVKMGKVKLSQIDRACRRVLKLKYDLGLFDDPYKYLDYEHRAAVTLTDENMAAALDAAQKSFVLLKNEGSVLPLKKGAKVALIGYLADSKKDMLGSWRAQCMAENCETVYEAMRSYLGASGLTYVQGCKPYDYSKAEFGKAVSAARNCDVVVMVVGERGDNSGEGEARTSIQLTGVQTELIAEIHKTGKPLVLVLMNGRPLDISRESEMADAILEAWFPGSKAGSAVTRTLFGEVNPSGKLPMCFPRNVGQVPVTYWEKPSSRPSKGPHIKYQSNYRDCENTPLYPFGYGLSYTTFDYSPVSLSSDEMTADGSITASVTVTNTGSVAGAEVVQLYIRDVLASVVRPGRLLKGFEKISLAPGESKRVEFEIDNSALAFWQDENTFAAEPGEFKVFIGPSSTTQNSATFTLR